MLLSRMRKDDNIHPGPFPFLPVPSRAGCRSDKHPLLPPFKILTERTLFLFFCSSAGEISLDSIDLNAC